MRIAVKMPLILICLTGSAAAQSNADSPVPVNVHIWRSGHASSELPVVNANQTFQLSG